LAIVLYNKALVLYIYILTIHLTYGRTNLTYRQKISKIRELRGMKQETLAAELGISQQAVSKIEQSADVDGEALEKISKILGVPADAIKNLMMMLF
jgi:DNA-binding XRE family transcriptional regulator